MKRPYLVNFCAISNDRNIIIRASVGKSKTEVPNVNNTDKKPKPLRNYVPIKSIGLFSKGTYKLKILGHHKDRKNIYSKEFESDSFGNFTFNIPKFIEKAELFTIEGLDVYEVSERPGIEFYLGSFVPFEIPKGPKVIISDFDKTLVDTAYSKPLEIYHSLSKPIDYFPKVGKSLDLLKSFTKKGYVPFILSASPHFYEKAIRNWLYQNNIYTNNIFLKDYRNFFSITQGIFTTKDFKSQGFYKLDQLVNILLMTEKPKVLVLMGDSFESDEFIYLVLSAVVKQKVEPWDIWEFINKNKMFNFTSRQTASFLTKFYKLGQITKGATTPQIDIHIRCKEENLSRTKEKTYHHPELDKLKRSIIYYIA